MIDVIEITHNPKYRLALVNALCAIRGREDKEDAKSCAIVALLEQEPITIDDCIACMKKAIERYRWSLRKLSSHETSIANLFEQTESEENEC